MTTWHLGTISFYFCDKADQVLLISIAALVQDSGALPAVVPIDSHITNSTPEAVDLLFLVTSCSGREERGDSSVVRV